MHALTRAGIVRLMIALVVGCGGLSLAWAQTTRPSGGEGRDDPSVDDRLGAALPHITINKDERYIDLEGEIVLREGLLELAVCVPNSKEHESVVAVKSRPQHVHLALLLLGLKPGQPGVWRYGEEEVVVEPPKGDRVKVSLVHEVEGERVERPISHYIHNTTDGRPLPGSTFVFAGSKMVQRPEGERFYAADVSGDVISLVTFGDELLAWPDPASTDNADLSWQPNKEHVPPLETKVIVRLRPAPKEKPAAEADAEGDDAKQ